jgi:two-component system chemotaxis sensor kinase CheA
VSDPELVRLLIDELERHLPALEAQPPDADRATRAVHALKGSAGLAGERELAAALERIHRRMRDGDASAFADATAVVRTAATRLRAGEPAVATRWPEPPEDLVARPLEPLVRAQYVSEVADRLARIDEALAAEGDAVEAVTVVYRQVHTIKGAASSVGDETMSWFCHGLEERLKGATSRPDAVQVLKEVVRWRALLGGLLDDPEAALRSLRGRQRVSNAPARSSVVPLDEEPPRSVSGDATIRVAASSVDRLFDRLEAVDLVRERIGVRADRAREIAKHVRMFRGGLVEALRLIGPPRPWGAPAAALRRVQDAVAALGVIGDEIDGAGTGLRSNDLTLKDAITGARKQLSAMRQMPVGRVFARLTTAVESEARRIDRAVIVRTRGADETIDRRVAELLVEPCMQIVRNAVAHGIEPPEVRAAAGKAQSGTVSLFARKAGNRLSITIQDDGAGVNVDELRDRAVAAGVVSNEIADAADDDTLLSLLFLPGFSTRDTTDLLAGRGIGLDIARSAVQRLGGAIRLSSRPGEGFSARVEVPIESGLVTVVWVGAGGEEYALPVAHVGGVRSHGANGGHLPHLQACLEAGTTERPAFAVDLDLHADDGSSELVSVGVDRVGRTEEILVRPLTPLVAGLGPFAGAIVRGDGSLRLALDPYAVAPRARALVRVDHARSSDLPPSSRPRARQR